MISPDHYRALLESAVFVRRDDRGRLRLRGADRLSYLHGLLTNDVATLQAGESRYAALLTAQGRMIADMNVHELGNMLLIELDRSLVTPIREHLDRFVITEDVTVEDVSESLAQVGLYGPGAAAVVRALRETPASVVASNEAGVAGFELIVDADRADDLITALRAAGATEVAGEVIEVTRIEAGIPRFLVEMDTTTIPLEAGIEERAISMSKGCYVGQEVIVRVLHRGGGRVAKKLVGLRLSAPVEREDRLWNDGREIGRVTSAVDSPRFGSIALGYVQRDFVEPGTAVMVKRDGSDVTGTVTSLPFTADGKW
jgi:folate-binding protein YgfZ